MSLNNAKLIIKFMNFLIEEKNIFKNNLHQNRRTFFILYVYRRLAYVMFLKTGEEISLPPERAALTWFDLNKNDHRS